MNKNAATSGRLIIAAYVRTFVFVFPVQVSQVG